MHTQKPRKKKTALRFAILTAGTAISVYNLKHRRLVEIYYNDVKTVKTKILF